MLSTRISPSFEDLLQLGQADAIERRKMVKAFAAGTNAFPDRLDAWHTRPFYIAALGLVRDHLRRRFIDFKLSAHFLDLRGLFFELGRESLYLFLLLRDRCFQLLNFANFAIEHGGALCRRAGRATTPRCATRRSRYATTLARAKIPAKVVVIKVQSNLNNGGAVNRLEVIEDTTDETLKGPAPVSVRDVTDADRTVFVGGEGTNEVADVSVIGASDHVWSCPCPHGCLLTAINVIEERLSANCHVVVSQTHSIRVTKREREITNGSVFAGVNIEKKRGIAKGVVAESV